MITTEEFTTKKRSKLLGFLVGKYFVVGFRGTRPAKFSLTCFNIMVDKFLKEGWGKSVLTSNLVFVSNDARVEYISGFSLALSALDLDDIEARKIGLLVPACFIKGESDDGSVAVGGLVLERYPEGMGWRG